MVYSVMDLIRLKIGFLLFLSFLLAFHVHHANGSNDYINSRCSSTANYTAGFSLFEANMQSVFSILTNDAPPVLFANATAGQGTSERVYGLVQCRDDVGEDDCRKCVQNSTLQVVKYCPNTRDAIIWYEKCQLRYSNTDFFGQLNTDDSGDWHWIYGKVQDPKAFYEKLGTLLKNLTSLATIEPSSFMFATGNIPYTDLQAIYGLVQCTRDTSLDACKLCLDSTTSQIQSTCNNSYGCEIATGSCRLRFDRQLFYLPTTTTRPSPPIHPGPRIKLMSVIIVVSVLIVVLTAFVTCGFYWWKREFRCFWRKKLKPGELQRNEDEECLEGQAFKRADAIDGPIFDLATINSATNSFAARNKLGEGGFGAVYKGQLPDGQEIAVKRLSRNIRHGAKQFDNEVQTFSKLQHRNLVRLLGGFLEGEEKILIYEYVRNRSLDNFLFEEPTKRMELDWAVRSKLINGIARGLLYLHEDSRLRIVHRDLKASNILLDEDMNPKISDFGTAKIFHMDQTQAETFEILGTRGYMAPEYLLEGKVSLKIDVFSFGVLLLEIISGKKNFSLTQQETDENMLNYVWRLWRENKAQQVVDQIMEGRCDKNEILRCIHIGLLCVQEDASSRPKMSKVVAMLENSSLILPSTLPLAPPIWNIRSICLGPEMSSTTSGIGSELGSSS